MPALNGSTSRVPLGHGVRVRAPGIVGTAELLPPTLFGVRDGEPERATEALTTALTNQNFRTAHSVEIAARPVGGPVAQPLRGPEGRPALELEVPVTGPDRRQVVLLADESGIVSWHFPQSGATPGTDRFVLPADVVVAPSGPDDPDGPGPDRGLVAVIGKKLLSVLVFAVLEAGARLAAEKVASSWEKKHRAPALRRFTASDYRSPGVAGPLWERLDAGPALLFLHGTFSTSRGGFGALDPELLAELSHRYGGRVLAYDHPTLSIDPLANVAALPALVPPGNRLTVDVVAHSRGGLVARALAAAAHDDPHLPIRVNRIVHVATPNAGTAMTDSKHLKHLIDRMTTMLNLIPDGPWSVVTDVLNGVLTTVKIIGAGAIGGLPGLQAMTPDGEWLRRLAARPAPPLPSYAVDADFEPAGRLAQLVRLPDVLIDRVFGTAPNDLIVPARTVRDTPSAAGFPIPVRDCHSFGRTATVWHCSYFGQAQTSALLRKWLPGTGP